MYSLPYILLNKYNDYLANKRTTSTFCICLSAVTGAQGSSKQKKSDECKGSKAAESLRES